MLGTTFYYWYDYMSMSRALIFSYVSTVAFTTIICIVSNQKMSTPTLNQLKGICSRSPSFLLGGSREPDTIKIFGESIYFGGTGYVYADTCSAGILNISARGIPAGDELPKLSIGLDSREIAEMSVGKVLNTSIFVPGKGRIALFYRNPYYDSEVRVVAIRDLKMKGCNSLKVIVPTSNAGYWFPDTNLMTLVRSTPAIVQSCSPGTLSFSIEGYKAGGKFPIVKFKQDGKILDIIQTSKKKNISMEVNGDRIYIEVTNPFARVYGHRQIYINAISFKELGEEK